MVILQTLTALCALAAAAAAVYAVYAQYRHDNEKRQPPQYGRQREKTVREWLFGGDE